MNKRMKKKQQNYISEDSMTKESSIRTKFSKFNKKWILVIVNVVVLVGVIVFVKTSYAYLYQTLRGQKSYSLKVKGFSLKLDDSSTSENIKIENSIPVSDEEGKVGNAYTFSIINEDPSETGYVLYLDDVEIDNEINRMKDTVVKYQLIENGKEQVGFVSELGTHPFRILTSGVMNGNETNNYSLRFWIKEDAEISAGQIFNVKIRVIATSKEAILEGKLIFGDTIVTSDSGITSMTSDELQTYVDRSLDQKKMEILDETHPVGSIYITETNKNPSELFGGKWEQYASGRTLIGQGSGSDGTTNKSFAVGSTGGEYNHLLTIDEMPTHTHIQNPHYHYQTMWYAGYAKWPEIVSPSLYVQDYNGSHIVNKDMHPMTGRMQAAYNGETQDTVAVNQNTGGNTTHNNIQPYITVYMWKRIK